jgi:hypothetical protein
MCTCKTTETFKRTTVNLVPRIINAKLRGKCYRAVCENSGSLHEVPFIGLSPNRELWAGVANSVLPFTQQSTPQYNLRLTGKGGTLLATPDPELTSSMKYLYRNTWWFRHEHRSVPRYIHVPAINDNIICRVSTNYTVYIYIYIYIYIGFNPFTAE